MSCRGGISCHCRFWLPEFGRSLDPLYFACNLTGMDFVTAKSAWVDLVPRCESSAVIVDCDGLTELQNKERGRAALPRSL
jgi:hypothetical protein